MWSFMSFLYSMVAAAVEAVLVYIWVIQVQCHPWPLCGTGDSSVNYKVKQRRPYHKIPTKYPKFLAPRTWTRNQPESRLASGCSLPLTEPQTNACNSILAIKPGHPSAHLAPCWCGGTQPKSPTSGAGQEESKMSSKNEGGMLLAMLLLLLLLLLLTLCVHHHCTRTWKVQK